MVTICLASGLKFDLHPRLTSYAVTEPGAQMPDERAADDAGRLACALLARQGNMQVASLASSGAPPSLNAHRPTLFIPPSVITAE